MINLSRPFIERPKATILLVAGFLALGLLAYFRLPVSSLPDVEFPTITVYGQVPGASAETMASSVAGPLERAFSNISGVTSMSSSSILGQTLITIQFELSRDIDAAAQDVQAAINASGGQLPKDMPNPPTYHKADPNGFALLVLAITSDTLPLPVVYDYVDNVLARAISSLPGVGTIDYHGDQVPAMRVQVDPEILAARGLDLEDVRTGLSQTTANQAKGALAGPKQTLLIGSNDQLLESSGYNNQIVAWQNGAPLRISDIGFAKDSVVERNTAASIRGKQCIIFDIHKQSGAKTNTTELVDRIKAELPHLRESMPPGIDIQVVGDHTQTTRAAVHDVEFTLCLTIGLVAFVIFVFLRSLKATAIPSVSIPLSLIGTFGVMYFLGYSLDNISLMGLTIAVGFVVDDAIVVMENIVRHAEMGKSRVQAALDGAGEVGFTVISMTLSLIAVFLPLLLMGGVIGVLLREFSVTVSIALIFSGIVSLTQTAVSCSLVLDEGHKPHGKLYRWVEQGFDASLRWYERGLSYVLVHRRLALGVTAALLLGSAYFFVIVPKGFVPEQDIGLITVVNESSPDTSFSAMWEREQGLAKIAADDPAVDNVYAFVEGRPSTNIGRMSVNLKPFAERKSTAAEVVARLRPKLAAVPGIKNYLKVFQDINIGANFSKTQYQYVLQDEDVGELADWAKTLEKKLQKLPQMIDVATDLNPSSPSVSVTVDRDKAASYGITAQAVDQILYDAFGQRQVATIYTPLSQRKVILEVGERWRLDAAGIRSIRIKSPKTGEQIPLTSIAKLEPTALAMQINHLNSYPAVTLSFNLAHGYALGDAVAAIRGVQGQLKTPARLRGSFQGSAKAFEESLGSQPLLICAAIAVVYIILGVLYESFLHPITILSSLPSATFGALGAMLIFHYDLSVMTLIGIILLVGIVKKNAIMMVDVALDLQRKEGKDAERAIFEACLVRFRPIMMTTMAALLGAIPLAVGTGAGSELRRPLGVAVVGGLFVSQAVTLFTVPIIFVYMDRLIQWSKRRFKPATSSLASPGVPNPLGS